MVRDHLYRSVDVYAGFDFDRTKVDMQGWGSDHPVLPWLIDNLKPSLIIEVGSWKGRSAINMAKRLESSGLSAEILCIDTWLGSPENWLAEGEKQWSYDSLRIINGQPRLYNTFLNNVVFNNCQNYITPFPLSSEAAYFVLKQLRVKAQMIYIDAGHEYETVSKDLEMYWQLLEDGGVMVLDDYMSWGGLTKAVNEFAAKSQIQPLGERGKVVLDKKSGLKFSTKILF